MPTNLKKERIEKLVTIKSKDDKKSIQIPKDILSYIFSYLEYKEMRNVRLVCHHWKYFVNEACLMQILEYSTMINFVFVFFIFYNFKNNLIIKIEMMKKHII